MNNDIHKIFEAYSKNRYNLINENLPVEIEGGYGGTGEEVTAEFPELAKGKYDLSPEETKAVFGKFLQKFRSVGGKSPKLYKDFYEMEIAPVIREVKPSINNTNAKYSSRVLYNALKAAKVLRDERDGVSGVKMEKKPSEAGVQKLATYTFKKAGELGKTEEEETEGITGQGEGIDDPAMKRFWIKILDEGDYTRDELIRMYIEDNPDIDDSDAKMSISSLIGTGYIVKSGPNQFKAVDPEEAHEGEEAKEGEGTGEVTSGYEDEDVEDFDKDQWGGVDVGRWRGDDSMN